MPFTFSHPAAILPFINIRNKTLSVSALVIGSIAPDFESFISLTNDKIYSHTWGGMFWYDMPLALLLFILFHLFIREAVYAHLPYEIKSRVVSFSEFSWSFSDLRMYWVVPLSLFIGILSHLLLDAFTHLNLKYPDSIHSQIYVGGTRLYIILQYSVSLFFLFLLAYKIKSLPQVKYVETQEQKSRFWIFIFLSSILVLAIYITTFLEDVIIDKILWIRILISAVSVALIIMCIFHQIGELILQRRQ